jgi:hypothetical protein
MTFDESTTLQSLLPHLANAANFLRSDGHLDSLGGVVRDLSLHHSGNLAGAVMAMNGMLLRDSARKDKQDAAD